ncbi:hypothetical protein [Flavobacterium sharifuzzamanii]|uniref:hypothetical protein n=1 Tax=Flavobacterium sharifuzzamanii TaxID=2211133 RepID=UPI000DAC27E3|nr:hypothetical protein [Flavobacterium sharifuzzamanii]KAF2080603.1 hypothetical protein DMA14_15005 [Flavobacterium sharifuzzamanii]
MTKEDAIEELMYQSGNHENIESERWQNGFLGHLRPFRGQLREENYHLIMKSLQILASEIEKDFVDKRIISSIMGICHLGRMWAIDPEGMLQSNNLISKEQTGQIDNWLIDISYAAFCLLDGAGAEEAFWNYNENNL